MYKGRQHTARERTADKLYLEKKKPSGMRTTFRCLASRTERLTRDGRRVAQPGAGSLCGPQLAHRQEKTKAAQSASPRQRRGDCIHAAATTLKSEILKTPRQS